MNQSIEQCRTIRDYKIHPACEIFPDLRGEEFDALVADIKKKGLILPIILINGVLIDGKNRYRACLKLNIAPVFMTYRGSLSPIDLVTSLNAIRRHSNPAKKAEIAIKIMNFLEDKDEDKKIEEALKGEDKAISDKVRFVRRKKKITAAAEIAGTTSEKMEQRFFIEEMAKEDSEIADDWEKAKKGKKSVSSVYRKAIKKQKLDENNESESEISNPEKPILAQVNEKLRTEIGEIRDEVIEWKDKYHTLKTIYENLEQKYNNLRNVMKTAFESAGIADGGSKKESPFPDIKQLREAGLKY